MVPTLAGCITDHCRHNASHNYASDGIDVCIAVLIINETPLKKRLPIEASNIHWKEYFTKQRWSSRLLVKQIAECNITSLLFWINWAVIDNNQ